MDSFNVSSSVYEPDVSVTAYEQILQSYKSDSKLMKAVNQQRQGSTERLSWILNEIGNFSQSIEAKVKLDKQLSDKYCRFSEVQPPIMINENSLELAATGYENVKELLNNNNNLK